jgi:hypothetical protein
MLSVVASQFFGHEYRYGTIRLTLNISTNQALDSLAIPGEGIKFNNGVYVSMPANAHLTVYYG